MFERFYRSTSARAMAGSGLGLAIVKQVVVKHGGMIRIGETFPGGTPPGTTFHVLLPGRRTVSTYRPDSAHSENGLGKRDFGSNSDTETPKPSVISVDS